MPTTITVTCPPGRQLPLTSEDLATDLIIVAVFFAGELLLIAEYTHKWLGFEKRSEAGRLPPYSMPRPFQPIQMVYVHRHYDPVPPL